VDIALGQAPPYPPRVLRLSVYFSLSRAVWIPCVIALDAETGDLQCVEGPEGFTLPATPKPAEPLPV